jgi:hypothetical protein
MNDDMEKYLMSFKLPEPSAGLRQRVLDSAQAYRRQQQTGIPAKFIRGVKISLSAAAIILASIIILNSLSFTRPEPDMKKYDTAIEQMVQFGISRESAASMITVWESARKVNTNQKNLLLGELS